jgi:hypothetical protein
MTKLAKKTRNERRKVSRFQSYFAFKCNLCRYTVALKSTQRFWRLLLHTKVTFGSLSKAGLYTTLMDTVDPPCAERA